jgi:hypothetical protein
VPYGFLLLEMVFIALKSFQFEVEAGFASAKTTLCQFVS